MMKMLKNNLRKASRLTLTLVELALFPYSYQILLHFQERT